MRQIGTLSSEQQAGIFEDYLLTRGIKSTIDETGEGWVVWIYNEDQIEQAREELNTYLENNDDPIYREVSQTARAVRKETEKLNKRAQKQVVDVRERWNRPLASRSPITFTLIMISVLVAVLTTSPEKGFWKLATKEGPLLNSLRITRTIVTDEGRFWEPNRGLQDVRNGQVWRLVTPIFIHLSLLHILFNMLWIRDLGGSVEVRLGRLKYLLIVLTIGVLSNAAQFFYNGPFFGGMSGVVFGLFGYVWMKSKFDPESSFYMHPNTVFFMIAWFFLCMTGFVGSIANMAHGVGLGVGIVLGYAPSLLRNVQRRI
jgi:GlpG protein